MLFIDLIYWFNFTFFITMFWIIFKYIRKILFFITLHFFGVKRAILLHLIYAFERNYLLEGGIFVFFGNNNNRGR